RSTRPRATHPAHRPGPAPPSPASRETRPANPPRATAAPAPRARATHHPPRVRARTPPANPAAAPTPHGKSPRRAPSETSPPARRSLPILPLIVHAEQLALQPRLRELPVALERPPRPPDDPRHLPLNPPRE